MKINPTHRGANPIPPWPTPRSPPRRPSPRWSCRRSPRMEGDQRGTSPGTWWPLVSLDGLALRAMASGGAVVGGGKSASIILSSRAVRERRRRSVRLRHDIGFLVGGGSGRWGDEGKREWHWEWGRAVGPFIAGWRLGSAQERANFSPWGPGWCQWLRPY